jgi:hypothetical protein
MFRDLFRRAAPPVTALAALLLTGCAGNNGPNRYRVSGSATLAGAPLVKGWVYFDPDLSKQNHGPQGFAPVVNGRYDTAAAEGRGTAGGPMVVRVEGEITVNGERMLVQYRTTDDLPRETAVRDYDAPRTSASRGPTGEDP